MEVIDSGEKTPLSVIRPCAMGVPSSGALNMSESSHLIIGYLLKDEYKALGI